MLKVAPQQQRPQPSQHNRRTSLSDSAGRQQYYYPTPPSTGYYPNGPVYPYSTAGASQVYPSPYYAPSSYYVAPAQQLQQQQSLPTATQQGQLYGYPPYYAPYYVPSYVPQQSFTPSQDYSQHVLKNPKLQEGHNYGPGSSSATSSQSDFTSTSTPSSATSFLYQRSPSKTVQSPKLRQQPQFNRTQSLPIGIDGVDGMPEKGDGNHDDTDGVDGAQDGMQEGASSSSSLLSGASPPFPDGMQSPSPPVSYVLKSSSSVLVPRSQASATQPRQSEFALWIGNIPTASSIMELVHFFASPLLESVFFIPKSNCAFVNYGTQEAENAALQRYSNARLNGVKIVCRPRRQSISTVYEIDSPERYFICKSLSEEDLVRSMQTCTWTTQPHNRAALNAAFKKSDVYLIFSANKSREYFGYAKMTSPVPDGDTNEDLALRRENSDTITRFVAGTAVVPDGKIVEDRSRNTIFWESSSSTGAGSKALSPADLSPGSAMSQPFSIEWQSQRRVPFSRTRGLLNPLNQNREVKVARDGTELDPSVGKTMMVLFHE